MVAGQSVEPALAVFQEEWDDRVPRSAISVLFVSALAHPDFLAEIEAVAIVPE